MNKNIVWVCYPKEKFTNSNWEVPPGPNRLALIPKTIFKSPSDPIPNPNIQGQMVIPSEYVKNLKIIKKPIVDSLESTQTQFIGNIAYHVVFTGEFDPIQFYYFKSNL